mgnify:CR=1 FL=1
MNQPPKIKSARKLIGFWNLIAVVLVVVIIFWLGTIFKNKTPSVWLVLTEPFNRVSSWLASMIPRFEGFKNAQIQQRLIAEKVKELSSLEAQVSALKSENEFLKSQLGLKNKVNFVPLVAHIINRDSLGLVDFLRVNLGSKDGVGKNMNVLGQNGVLVGKVESAELKSSRVILLSDPLSRVTAKTNNASGVVVGQLKSSLIFDLIPKNQLVKPDDLVVSSGLDGIYIPGLPIGRVKKVINLDSELYQQAIIEPLVNCTELSDVLVIQGLK